MSLFIQRFSLSVVVTLTLFASSAAAQMCDLILALTPNHAAIISASNGTSSSANTTDALNRTLEDAGELSQFFIPDEALRRAMVRYQSDIQGLRTTLRLSGTSAAARYAATDAFRNSTRILSRLGQNHCGDLTTGSSLGAPMGLTALSWKVVAPVGLIVVVLCAGSGLVAFHRIGLRRARRIRHDCNLVVQLTASGQTHQTRMIDVSAIGAKLARPTALGAVTGAVITFDDTDFSCTRAWDNAHYIGFAFHPPLPLSVVHGSAIRRQRQRVPKTQSAIDQDTAPPNTKKGGTVSGTAPS